MVAFFWNAWQLSHYLANFYTMQFTVLKSIPPFCFQSLILSLLSGNYMIFITMIMNGWSSIINYSNIHCVLCDVFCSGLAIQTWCYMSTDVWPYRAVSGMLHIETVWHCYSTTHTWCTVHGLEFWTMWHYTPQEDWCCCREWSKQCTEISDEWRLFLKVNVLDDPHFWVFICMFPYLAQIIGVVLCFEATRNECPLEWAFVWILWSYNHAVVGFSVVLERYDVNSSVLSSHLQVHGFPTSLLIIVEVFWYVTFILILRACLFYRQDNLGP